MSYILDALKKADAEREREGVPTLHTRHGDHNDASASLSVSADTSQRLPWLLGGLLGGAALVLGGWWAMAPSEPASQAPANAPAVVTQTATSAAVQPASPTPTPPMQQPVATLSAASLPSPAVTAATPTASPVAAERKTTSRSSEGNALRVDASLRETPPRVVPVSELPEDVRRELPALSIGGAMHSDVPTSRMLILNGSVFHEGDQPAPGLVLEEIKLKSAVFRFKGHRYSVAY